jgi:hypothetical protein
VPMPLLSWVRVVGDVWLVGTHPQWAASASADPLVIEAEDSRYAGEPTRGSFEESHEAWHEWAAQDPAAGRTWPSAAMMIRISAMFAAIADVHAKRGRCINMRPGRLPARL